MKKILLDLDEVLVDFVGAAAKIHGWTLERLYTLWEIGIWDMAAGMRMSPVDFWTPINDAGAAFWENLEETPWADELIGLVKSHSSSWAIASTPSYHQSSYIGKTNWLQRKFGPDFIDFHLTHAKGDFADADTILIDDREKTVNVFRAFGGQAILFPARHNRHHALAADPMPYVSQVLKELTQCT